MSYREFAFALIASIAVLLATGCAGLPIPEAMKAEVATY